MKFRRLEDYGFQTRQRQRDLERNWDNWKMNEEYKLLGELRHRESREQALVEHLEGALSRIDVLEARVSTL